MAPDRLPRTGQLHTIELPVFSTSPYNQFFYHLCQCQYVALGHDRSETLQLRYRRPRIRDSVPYMGAKEVSFDGIQDAQVRNKLKEFDRIVGCCHQALQDGFEWAGIDTYCIDKRSSAGLSEAINSMYE